MACASAPSESSDPQFVSLGAVDPTIALDLRYAGAHNFVGAPIDGYERALCLLSEPAVRALAAVQTDLRAESLGLLVYDCYRPQRAVDHFARWAADLDDVRSQAAYHPRVPKSELFARGYIALRSSHSRGSTVDVALLGADGAPLDMGTPFDFFDPRSHIESAEISDAARSRRLRLRAAMERRGFRNLAVEWWHYTLVGEPHLDRFFDAPIR